MAESKELSLFELNSIVKDVLHQCMPDRYWVRAELSDVRQVPAGHCYLEFIEKDSRGNQIIARARGNIWGVRWSLLRPMFETQTGETFHSGLKVLVQVTVEFHEAFGYSLVVNDIDPSYTMGDMMRQRREILQRLENEGVKDMNQLLQMPSKAQRIAVISSASAAGYGDFMDQLENNPMGYKFYTHLFPAVMQGQQAEKSIIAALDHINEYQDLFDVVVIIRGGGATSDLSCFDNYNLASNVAQFPLPVITGIGHDRDKTVLDLVANTSVKTPTAVAEFLLSKVNEVYLVLSHLQDKVRSLVEAYSQKEKEHLASLTESVPHIIKLRLTNEKSQLQRLSSRIAELSRGTMSRQQTRLELLKERIRSGITSRLSYEQQHLEHIGNKVELLSPENLLRKGYTLTICNGQVVKSVSQLKKGDEIITVFADGEAKSVVKIKS